MNIIKIPFQIVKPLFRSIWFWVVILVLVLLFWASKGDVSKMAKVLKLLARFVFKVVELFLALFGIQVKKMFDEVGL